MITFDRINRRTHLYLGLFLLPWLLMYGFSSLLISHPDWFKPKNEPPWTPLFEREYSLAIPEKEDPRESAMKVLADVGMEGAFWAQRPNPGELRITRFRFRDQVRLTYLVAQQRLKAERQEQTARQVVVRLHFRGGFQQTSFWDDVWALLVDGVCLAILAWIASGLWMWWRLPRTRLWGALALAGGVLSFLILVWTL